MPLPLSELQKHALPFEMELGDMTLRGTFYTARMGQSLTDKIQEVTQRVEGLLKKGKPLPKHAANGLAHTLAHVLASWELVDEAGQPLPITVPVLAEQVGDYAMLRLSKAIGDAYNPNAVSGADES